MNVCENGCVGVSLSVCIHTSETGCSKRAYCFAIITILVVVLLYVHLVRHACY